MSSMTGATRAWIPAASARDRNRRVDLVITPPENRMDIGAQ